MNSPKRFAVIIQLSLALLLAIACESNPAPPPTSTPPPVAPTAASTAAPTARATAVWSVNTQPLDTVIRLSWTAVPGARGYNFYRDGNSTPLNAAPVSDLTADDIGLTNGRTYRYTLNALDSTGQVIARSPEVSATPKAP